MTQASFRVPRYKKCDKKWSDNVVQWLRALDVFWSNGIGVGQNSLQVADLTPLSVEDSLDQKNLPGIKEKRKWLCVQMGA